MPRIDAHLHVFTNASPEFPRETSDVWPPDREEPVEKLLSEMERNQIDQAVLVQMAGTSLEQHRYLLRCLKDYPNRFLGIGLSRASRWTSESCCTHGAIDRWHRNYWVSAFYIWRTA